MRIKWPDEPTNVFSVVFSFFFKDRQRQRETVYRRKKEPGSRVSYLRFRSSVAPLKEASEDRITGSIHPWTSAWLNMSRVCQEPPLFLRSNGQTRPKKNVTPPIHTQHTRLHALLAIFGRSSFHLSLFRSVSFQFFETKSRPFHHLATISGAPSSKVCFSRNVSLILFSLSPSRELFITAHIYAATSSATKWKYFQSRFFFFLYELRNRVIKEGATEACAFHMEFNPLEYAILNSQPFSPRPLPQPSRDTEL